MMVDDGKRCISILCGHHHSLTRLSGASVSILQARLLAAFAVSISWPGRGVPSWAGGTSASYEVMQLKRRLAFTRDWIASKLGNLAISSDDALAAFPRHGGWCLPSFESREVVDDVRVVVVGSK